MINPGKFPLTEEQENFISLALTGVDILGNACAGSGKTSTAVALATNLVAAGKRGTYICFNKANAVEAECKFPEGVACKTAHSLAYRYYGKYFRKRLRRVKASNYVDLFPETNFVIESNEETLEALALTGLALATVVNFTHSGATEITSDLVDLSKTITFYTGLQEDTKEVHLLTERITDMAQTVWEHMSSFKGSYPVTHDTYLKLWQLNDPRIFGDFIIFDEAQDASGVMLAAVEAQTCQKIYIGDRFQQIYSWRGAVNALEKVSGCEEVSLTQAFRYGQPIADLANTILNHYKEADSAIVGFPAYADSEITELTDYDAYICRTNLGVMERLVEGIAKGEKITALGGIEPLIKIFESVQKLMDGQWASVPELIGFASWGSVKKYSQRDEGSDLRALVKIVDTWGIENLLGKLGQLKGLDPKDADIIVTTGHKCKGWEWDRVKLSPDFIYDARIYPDVEGFNEMPFWDQAEYAPNGLKDETVNLLYVAVTRAQKALDISDVEPITEIL